MTKIVGGTIVRPDGQALASVPIEIELVLAEGFVVIGSYSLAPKITVQTSSNGTWQTPLIENDAITPTGTIYRVTEKTPSQFGSSKSYYIQVLTGLGGGINQVGTLLVPAPVPVGGTYQAIASGPSGDAGYIEVADIAARDALTPHPAKLVLTLDSGVLWSHNGTTYRPVGVPSFTSVANRATFQPSPLPGDANYLKNNLVDEGLYFRNSANQYRPPWNLPWGVLDQNTSGLTSPVTLSSLNVFMPLFLNKANVTLLLGRRYRIGCTIRAVSQATTVAQMTLQLFDNNVVQPFTDSYQVCHVGYFVRISAEHIRNGDGASHSFDWRGRSNALTTSVYTDSTGTISTVEDVGPSGAPS